MVVVEEFYFLQSLLRQVRLVDGSLAKDEDWLGKLTMSASKKATVIAAPTLHLFSR